ncbi:hypothetical protein V8C26DRAFT_427913 [Trichoderma gracile]
MNTGNGPKLETQAESLTGPNNSYNDATGSNITSAQESVLPDQGPAGDGHCCLSLQIDSVKVLSWPVFAGLFDPQAKAIAVLPQEHSARHQPSVSGLDSFLRDVAFADNLVFAFIHKIHIKNPLLDALSLRNRAYLVYSAGIE